MHSYQLERMQQGIHGRTYKRQYAVLNLIERFRELIKKTSTVFACQFQINYPQNITFCHSK